METPPSNSHARRDEFRPATVRLLRERVANRCSNPACIANTVAGDATKLESVISIGQAAHIHAAAEGGPRYDPAMTPEERASFGNGIWLCNNCARHIDREVGAHPAELLRRWKEQAEAAARADLGKRPLTDDAAVSTLATALTGLGTVLDLRAVEHIHAATERSLQQLDPRIEVRTIRDANGTRLELEAKEPVNLDLVVPPAVRAEWDAGLRRVHDYGDEASFALQGVDVSGSPLVREMVSRSARAGGKINFVPATKKATLRMTFVNEAKVPCPIADVQGSLAPGFKSHKFKGSMFGASSVEMPVAAQGFHTAALTVHLHVKMWQGIDILDLPYFDELMAFTNHMRQRDRFEFSVQTGGRTASRGSGVFDPPKEFGRVERCLMYVRMAQHVCRSLGLTALFSPEEVPGREAVQLAQIAMLVDAEAGAQPLTRVPIPKMKMKCDAAELQRLTLGGPHPLVYRWRPRMIRIFQSEVSVPEVEVSISSCFATVDATAEDAVVLNFSQGTDAKLAVRFIRDAAAPAFIPRSTA